MKVLEHLIAQLEQLPGIGSRTAERLAYHLLKVPTAEAIALADAIHAVKEGVRECPRCHNIAEGEICGICADDSRDAGIICVVEQPKDLIVIEQSGRFRGRYHVLGGNFAPMEGRGAEALTVSHLVERATREEIREVIIATNPDFEGDGTAMIVWEALAPTGVRVSRIARGVPSGGHLEYMNRRIIRDALEGRTQYGVASEDPPRGEE